MVEQSIEQISDRLLERFPANRSYTRRELSDGLEGLPQPVAHFLMHTVDEKIDSSLQALRTSSWFQITSERGEQVLADLRDELHREARIPTHAWESSLTAAVDRVLRFLVDPSSELAEFAFPSDRKRLPIDEVQARMQYFTPYRYLYQVFIALVERKDLETLSKQQYTDLLLRIDQRVIAEFSAEKWVRTLRPLFGFFEIASPANQPGIPVPILERYFTRKEVSEVVERLKSTPEKALSPDALEKLLERAPAPQQSDSPSRPAADHKTVDQPAPRRPNSGPSSDPEPRWKQFQRKSTQPETGAGSGSTQSRKQKTSSTELSSGSGEPLWRRFQGANPEAEGATRSSEHPLTSSSSAIDELEQEVLGHVNPDQRNQFVDHLFDGDIDQYVDVLRELQQVESWNEAASMIAQQVFLPNHVNIYSEPAVTFTDRVEMQFRESSHA